MYPLADETYAKLVDQFAKDNFGGMPAELRAAILDFFRDESAVAGNLKQKDAAKLRRQVEMLRMQNRF